MCVLFFLPESVVHNVGSLGPEGELCYSFVIVGQKVGKHRLVVGLESNTVELVTGMLEVTLLDWPTHVQTCNFHVYAAKLLAALNVNSWTLSHSYSVCSHHPPPPACTKP